MRTRRFPIGPLLARCPSKREIARRAGLSPQALRDPRGLTVGTADRAAVALGYHAALIWPEWFSDEDVA
jgi:lambda repressor-like predicted transcriptional regulator